MSAKAANSKRIPTVEETNYLSKLNPSKQCFKEVKGDLFKCDEDVSLAHCVSEDLNMGKGIAVEFKKRFAGVDELRAQNLNVGNCGFLKRDNRYVFYLITKTQYFKKPTYISLSDSLKIMKDLCLKFNVTKLAMPKIGCGLDRLEWEHVARIINNVFESTNIEITVCTI